MDDIEFVVPHVGSVAAADAVRETLALTQAFVVVLLTEQPGPLTLVQRDLLETIQERVSCRLSDAG